MQHILLLVTVVVLLGVPTLAPAGPKEEVAAATQAWIESMNSHDPERVFALYDPEAVLWGTRSPTLRDTPATVRDYFNILRTVDPSYTAVLGE
jgi:hypothetical protein